MRHWYRLLSGILIGLLAAGVVLLISQPKRGYPITLAPAPTPTKSPLPKPTSTNTPIQVQINGAIVSPGIYTMDLTNRLGDLIEIAGGLSPIADESRINFVLTLHDGDYIYIPSIGEDIPETARNAPENMNLNDLLTFNYPLDLNEASQDALESLPGIGPTKASDIIAYRDQFGPFVSIDDLIHIDGIGPTTLETLREYLIIEQ